MYFENSEENKEEWLKNEKRIRTKLLCVLLVVLCLFIVLVFFRKHIWVIISNIAILIGLIVDLLTLINNRKRR